MLIRELHQTLGECMRARDAVKKQIAVLEDLLKSTHWIEQEWHQINSFAIDLSRLNLPETKNLLSILKEKDHD